MISIIICSIDSIKLNRLELNIKETIGTAYEIIAVNNKGTNNGICSVYNQGGAKAIYPILCFIHEDIYFETTDWGQLLLNHFNNREIGLVGLAGGDSKSLVPSTWSTSCTSNEINIIQHTKSGNKAGQHIFITAGRNYQNRKRVIALDGVFLCTRKDIFEQFKFDETNLKGFHGYDIDYSLQVQTRYTVMVIFDILIHHYSEGTPGREWLESTITVSNKWRSQLPLSVYPLSKKEFNYYHWKSLQIFLEQLFRLQYSYRRIVYFYLYYSFTRYFTIRRFLSLGKFVMVNIVNPYKFRRKSVKGNYELGEMITTR